MRRKLTQQRALITILLICGLNASVAWSLTPGRSAGEADVSATGAASYSIPIWAPPGVNGLVPHLALNYGSNGRDGILGAGWSIGGLSEITRCVQTKAQDGALGPIQLGLTDKFCVDGQRLRLTSGTYGYPGSTYQTEIDTVARVTAMSSAGNGPAWFKVETKDGLTLEYGGTVDSRIEAGGGASATTLTWALDKISDRVGNYISFVYEEDTTNRTYRLSEINYPTLAVGGGPYYKLQFVYESRVPDIRTRFAAGYQSTDTQRLDRIDEYWNNAGWQLIRRYDLSYENAPSTGVTRLTSIQECSATDCYSPTTISYQNGSAGLTAEVSTGAYLPQFGGTPIPLDMNGDGRDDLVYANTSTNTFWVMFGNGSGFSAPQETSGSSANFASAFTIDYNGDGLIDLLIPNSSNQWRVLVSNGTTFTALDTGLPATGAGGNCWVADIDGDGLPDLIWTQGGNLLGRFNTGSGFSTTVTTLYSLTDIYDTFTASGLSTFGPPTSRYLSSIRQADFNGDGRTDLVIRFARDLSEGLGPNYEFHYRVLFSRGDHYDAVNDLGIRAGYESPIVADVNGDGLSDVLVDNKTVWRLWLGTGGGALQNTGLTIPYGSHANTSWAMDWDGDGCADFISRYGAVYNWYRWNGTAFSAAASTGITEASTSTTNHADLRVMDVNGDGLSDWAFQDPGNNRLVKFALHAGVPPDLAQTITDGFGVAATYSYAQISDPTVHTKCTPGVCGAVSFPVREIQSSSTVVRQLTGTDRSGTGSTTTQSFTYLGARVHLQGRGFLGFYKRTVVDSTLGYNQQAEETYRQDFPYVGRQSGLTVKLSSGAKIRESTTAWNALSAGSGNDVRYLPYATSTTDKSYEIAGIYAGTQTATRTVAVNSIDTYGTVTDATTTTTENNTGLNAGASKLERVWHSSVLNDTSTWCLGRAQTTQLINSHTLAVGTSVTRTIGTVWDSTLCRPTQQQLEPGDPQWQVTKALDYDTFGNVNHEYVTGAGMATRATHTSWGLRGQFRENITNALSQSTVLGYRYDLGLLVSVTDANQLQTVIQYDSFGRPILQTLADGPRTSWSYNSCTGCDSRMRYEVRVESQNSSGTTFQVTRHQFDQFDREVTALTQLSSGAYSKRLIALDARGRVSQIYAPYWEGFNHNGYRKLSYDQVDRATADQLYTANGVLDRSSYIQRDGLTTVVTDPMSHNKTLYRTAWGDLVRTTDTTAHSTSYQYDAFGLLKRVDDANGNITESITYNSRGMVVSHGNMDRGTWSFTPNALGELVSQLDARGNATSLYYDLLGRVVRRTEPEGETNWTWDTAVGKGIGQLASVTSPGYGESYVYDTLGRVQSVSYAEDQTYEYRLTYNNIGEVDTLTYPVSNGNYRLKVSYGYSYGQLTQVADANAGTVFWTQNASDALGNAIDEQLANGLHVISDFDPLTGRINGRSSGSGGSTNNIQWLGYQWNADGNLRQRDDLLRNLSEVFNYDDGLHRLTTSTLNGAVNLSVSYDATGNIQSKSGVGTYTYDSVRKHAVASAGGVSYSYDANGNMVSRGGGTISWYSFNLPSTISDGTLYSQFFYGASRQRWKQVAAFADGTQTTVYIGGLMEKVRSPAGKAYRHLIPAGSSTVVYTRWCDGTINTFYSTSDHLGSTSAITCGPDVSGCATGSLYVQENFDAFGSRRNTAWNGAPAALDRTKIAQTTRRGFTGHEMLDNLGLVHMGGRVYDPALGRFLSPDVLVEDASSGQAFNRYSYTANNPLSLIDPTGFDTQPSDCQGNLCNVPNTPFKTEERKEAVVRVIGHPDREPDPGPNLWAWHDFGTTSHVNYAMSEIVLTSRQSIKVPINSDQKLGEVHGGMASGSTFNRIVETVLPMQAFVCLFDGGCSSGQATVAAAGFIVGIIPGGGVLGEAGASAARTGTITLYRAVSMAEHADIAASGVLRPGPNSFSTGKWFWESAEHAAQFGTIMDGAGNFRVIEATFPRSAADQFMRLDRLDGIGPAQFGTFEQLGNPLLRPLPGAR